MRRRSGLSGCGNPGRRLGSTYFVFFFQAEDGIRDDLVTGVQTCALPISSPGCALVSCNRAWDQHGRAAWARKAKHVAVGIRNGELRGRMKLVSWNVNGVRAVLKKGFLDYMAKVDADVLCLQEKIGRAHV